MGNLGMFLSIILDGRTSWIMFIRTGRIWCQPWWNGKHFISTWWWIEHDICFCLYQWPYSYDTCDVGTLPNQTYPLTSSGVTTPLAATQDGDPKYDGVLVSERLSSDHRRDLSNLLNIKSFLPGQKLCKHPSNCEEFGWAHLHSTMYMPRRITPWTNACRRQLCWSCCTWNWCTWSYCYGWCRNGMSCLLCSYSPSHKLSRARFPHNLDHSMQVPT